RKVIAKGRTYYQLVRGKRVDGKVRQEVLVSLGSDSDPRTALGRMKRRLTQQKRELGRWDAAYPTGCKHVPPSVDRNRDRLRRAIFKLTLNIEMLDSLIRHPTTSWVLRGRP